MPDNDDLATRWLVKLKSRPAIAALVVVAIVIGGIARILSDSASIYDVFIGFFRSPYVVAFTLSPDAFGFSESNEVLFGDGPRYRTFEPERPFDRAPVAIFLVTVDNPTNHDIIITKALYDIDQVGHREGVYAASDPLNRFLERKTEESPIISYGTLLPLEVSKRLLTLVKSHVTCSNTLITPRP